MGTEGGSGVTVFHGNVPGIELCVAGCGSCGGACCCRGGGGGTGGGNGGKPARIRVRSARSFSSSIHCLTNSNSLDCNNDGSRLREATALRKLPISDSVRELACLMQIAPVLTVCLPSTTDASVQRKRWPHLNVAPRTGTPRSNAAMVTTRICSSLSL